MLKLSNMKLKSQLLFLVVAAFIMMSVVQLFYHYGFYSITKERAYTYFENYTAQIENEWNSALDTVEQLTKTISNSRNLQKYIVEEDKYERLGLMAYARDNLEYSIAGNSHVMTLRVIDRKSSWLNAGVSNQEIEILIKKIINDYNLGSGYCESAFYTKSYYEPFTKKRYFAFINPIYSAIEGEFHAEPIGVCITLCNLYSLSRGVESSAKELADMVFILTEGDDVIYSNNLNMIGKKLDRDIRLTEGRSEIVFEEKECIAQTTRIRKTGWKITTLIPTNELVKDIAPIRTIGTGLIAATIILLLIVEIIIMRGISVPLKKIVNEMSVIGRRDIRYRIQIPCENEVGIIAKDINLMLDKLENMTRKIFNTQNALYEAELRKKQAELSLFQSQINPHFLYNTLECIRSMAQAYNAVGIEEISKAMARIFRYAVKEANIVTLREELESVKDYFSIMTIRYMGKFKLKIFIDEELLDAKIIKMIMQPIVENSIKHGLEGVKRNGIVCIQGFADEAHNTLSIRVTDNGRGIDANKLEEINKSFCDNSFSEEVEVSSQGGIALSNINRRIKLTYGEQYGIRVNSRLRHWTTVTVTIPITA